MTRKLFFGLFIFPLLIAVGMAVLLCSVVLLTHEEATPESLVAAIKAGSPGKRWEKAFELSNELNRSKNGLRTDAVMQSIIHILQDPAHYDAKTRSYMAVALGHFRKPQAVDALRMSLKDSDTDVQLYSLWALGVLQAKKTVDEIVPFLKSDKEDLRKIACYVLGIMADRRVILELRLRLNDPAADVRWNAALALARLKDPSGLDTIVKMLDRNSLANDYKMSEQQIEAVMINAAKGLALVSGERSQGLLADISKHEKNLKVRQAALNALEYRGTPPDNQALLMENIGS